ncbi:MAG: hypothetical protein ACR2NR_05430 [Solirubrobacteraceae bacterium]
MNVRRALARLQAPDESAAQARTWEVVSAAYRERSPVVKRRSRRTLALAPALVALVAVMSLTPAGATVSRLISHALGVPHASRALVSLPTPGRLLISGPDGTWTVSADGSRTRIGSWRQASWSPHGLYIAVAAGDRLAAVNPNGVTQWALTRPAVSDPRWYPPTGFRVAYRSGSTLRVVAGDGTSDHQFATGVAPVAPAWRPDHPYQLAYAHGEQVIVRDADTRRVIWARPARDVQKLGWSAGGARLLVITRTDIRALGAGGRTISTITLTPHSPAIDASLSPDGQTLALVRGGADQGVTVARLTSSRPALRSVLAGFGVRQVLWSPNGRWLLVSWPAADQWVFIAITGTPRIAAVSRIARQFTSQSQANGFPQLDGWCCTARGAAG